MEKARIFIGVPTTRGVISRQTSVSLYRTGVRLASRGIENDLVTIDGFTVSEARDHLANQFLNSAATHFLFVDSDIQFQPDACEKLLTSEKPFIGAAYTQKQINFEKMKTSIEAGSSFEDAFAAAHTFNVYRRPTAMKDGLFNVEWIAAGFMLIARSVFETISERLTPRRYELTGRQLTGFFDRELVGNNLLGEDFSFSRRWRACGGDIWIDPSLDIRHIGEMSFGFPISAMLPKTAPATSEQPEQDYPD